MIGTTAAIIGSAAIGAAGSAYAASKSASAQKKAADSSNALQYQMFSETKEAQKPFVDAGTNALAQIPSLVNDVPELGLPVYSEGFEASPGFQYALRQAQDAIQQSAAARGGAISGNTLNALQGNALGMAQQDYWNYVGQNRQGMLDQYGAQQNRLGNLMGLATMGQNAAANVGSAGQNYAANAGNALMAAGSARANAYTNMGNAFSGFSGIAGNALAQPTQYPPAPYSSGFGFY